MKDTSCRNTHDPRKMALFMLGLLAALSLLPPAPAPAKPTSSNQARQVVAGWLKLDRKPLGAALAPDVNRVETYRNPKGQALYHIVYLKPEGLVIVGGDDLVEPILGFLPEAAQYDPSERNPLGALVSRDAAGRVQAARQAAGKPGQDGALAKSMAVATQKWSMLEAAEGLAGNEKGLGQISDVRVDALLKSTWDQSAVANQPCYNYYTPNNYYCGCVATAMAQLLRYYQYPTAGVGTGSFTITIAGANQTAKLRGGDGNGGPYNWPGMPLGPGSSITTEQRQAIGALTYDAGIAVGMAYTSTGSATDTLLAADALKTTFKFGNAIKGYDNEKNIAADTMTGMINPNLDAGYPVLFGITDGKNGHAIVCDGYGFNSTTAYHHLNMGWSGLDNAWYNLPDISTTSYNFNTIYKIIYNAFTSGSGEIISGRVTTTSGTPVAGATVTATRGSGGTYSATTNSNGIYALARIPASSSYTIKVAAAGYTVAGKTASTGRSTDGSPTCGNAWGVNFTASKDAAPAMTVTPATGLSAAGNFGGPFTPANTVLTVKNTGNAKMAWSASKTQNWVTVSPASGTLAAGASVAVTVSFNAGAKSLASGIHRDTISFANKTNKVGDTTRGVTLAIHGATQSFTIYNDGEGSLTVNSLALDAAAAWITWDVATPFTVAPKGSRAIKIYVTYPLAPLGTATRHIVVKSNDTARNPYPGGVTIVTNKTKP